MAGWAVSQVVVLAELLAIGGGAMQKSRFLHSFVIIFIASVCSFSHVQAADSAEPAGASAQARVLELSAQIEINGPEQKTVSLGLCLTQDDTLMIPEGGYVTLLFRDGTVYCFDGPTTVTLSLTPNQERQSVLAKLSSALLSLLFSKGEKQIDVATGSREPEFTDTLNSLPLRLLYPPADCHLIAPPRELRWQPFERALSYTVSLFDSTQLLWQHQTNYTSIELPLPDSLVKPGNAYWWQVKAADDKAYLASGQAMFYVLDKTMAAELNKRVAEIDSSVTDQKLSYLLKAVLYRDLGLKLECYRVIQSLLKAFPGDYTASIIEAELQQELSLMM